MESCGHFQSQMLDYVYELLDGAEERAVHVHLQHCPSCRAALAQAQAQQQLLAAAARLEFPQVHFTAPIQRLEPASVELVTPVVRRQPAWFPLVVALSLVVGVGVAAYFGGRAWSGYRTEQARARNAEKAHDDALAKAKQLQKDHEARIALLRQEEGEVIKDLNQNLPVKQQQELDDLNKAANARKLNVLVSGPEVIQPGRKNEYLVQTQDLNNAPVAAKIEARLVNQEKKVVYEPVVEATGNKGQFKVSFQPDVPLYANQHLTLEVKAQREDGSQVPVTGPVEVAGKAVYFTHLATDKPMYQPGEVVHFRSLTLDRATLKPPSEDLQIVFSVTDSREPPQEVYNSQPHSAVLMDETGKPVNGPDNKPIRGVGAGEFTIDPKWSGGQYTLTVREQNNRFQPQVRKFRVARYEKPRLNTELDFGQKSYGAGQEVTATATAETVDTKVKLANKPAQVTITIDGKWYDLEGKEFTKEKKLSQTTDKDGALKLRFKLPQDIDRGDANLAVTFEDEAIVRAIPLVMKKLNVEFFPEGGDLVAGLPNRVYFQVKSTLDKPADLRGSIVYMDGDQEKVEVADVQTLHDDNKEARGFNLGMGAFTITPVAGRKYQLKVQEPIGIESKPELPAVKNSGVVLTIATGVFTDKDPIKATIRSSGGRSFWVGAYCRGRLVDQQAVKVKDGNEATVELKPAAASGGVCRVTVFEEVKGEKDRVNLQPVAERLVYCVPSERLNLTVAPDKAQAVPGERVSANLSAKNEAGALNGAIVTVVVFDQRVAKMADEKTARSMPTQFYLASEVRGPEELEFADFLLSNHPKAKVALDLLLGTQGWRRFAEQDVEKFRQQNKGKQNSDVERLLVLNGQSQPNQQVLDLNQAEQAAVFTKYQGLVAQAQQKLAQTESDQEAEKATAQQDQDTQKGLAEAALADYRSAVDEVDRFDRMLARFKWVVLPAMVVTLALLGMISLIVALVRHVSKAVPYYVATAMCFVVLAGVVGFFMWQKSNAGGFAKADTGKMQQDAERMFHQRGPKSETMPTGSNAAMDPRPGLPEDEADLARGGNLVPGAAPGVGLGGGAGGRNGFHAGDDKAKAGEGKADAREFDKKAVERAEKEARRDAEALRVLNGLAREAKDGKGGVDRQADAQLKLLEQQQFAGKRAGGPQNMRGRPGWNGPRADMAQPQLPQFEPFMVREYAHASRSHTDGTAREDWAETLYWNPTLVVPNGGSQNFSFDLCDSVTTFQVMAFGYTLDGRLGATTTEVRSVLPFTVEPKLPLEVTSSDRIDLPVKVSNNGAADRDVTIKAEANGLKLDGAVSQDFSVAVNSHARKIFRFQPTITDGNAQLLFTGESKPFSGDSVAAKIRVVPDGFPVVKSKSDLLEGQAANEVALPETWVKGTLRCQVEVFPSTLADLQKGLEGLLREPGGCFEQTSTANYPNLLILDYMRESNQVNPQIEQDARGKLSRGYQMLTGFECQPPGTKKQGYEWFGGQSPAHEALTAYGLMEFRDMSRVMKVDDEMVERTRKYLMEQKDGKGGFKRNARALDTFGRAPEEITNAYIVWSITESGKDDDVEKELTSLNEKALTSMDPYFIALVANSLLNRSKSKEGVELLKKLTDQQKEDGHLDAATTSITCSGGRDLQIETTAISVLAWLKRPEFAGPVNKAVKWISGQRGGYGAFGSTQSTIMALKALIAFTKANKKTAEAGTLSLFVNAERVGTLDFAAGTQGVLAIDVPEPEKHLSAGANKVRVEISGNNAFPYTLSWSYRTVKPVSEDCPLKLTTKLDRATAQEGDVASLMVTIENTSKKDVNMPIAIIGLPGGMQLPKDYKQFDALKQLRDNGKTPGIISAYELRSNERELVLYWRGLSAGQKVDVPLQVICQVPGEYHGPASRAYLYYDADKKCWIDPIGIEIKAKE